MKFEIPIASAAFAAMLSLSVGQVAAQSHEWSLEGNPSTGYVWVLDEENSTGLDLVEVESLGYRKDTDSSGKTLMGAPRRFYFRLTFQKPGSAKLVFSYLRPWVKTVKESHAHDVKCE